MSRQRGRRRGPSGPWYVVLLSKLVGACASQTSAAIAVAKADDGDVIATKNDYELVVRSSKELENALEVYFGAKGKGLHEKASSVEHMLSRDLVRQIRFLATIRNKLVHERGFNEIPDRARFINDFRAARAEMKQLIAQRGRKGAGGADICTIM